MVTRLGKVLRKMRIDRGELLRDMAACLGMSPAMLSAIENGKRKPAEGFAGLVAKKYGLSASELGELEEAVAEQRAEVTIGLAERGRQDRELAVAFARQFDSLDANAKEGIRKILAQSKEEVH